MLLNDISSGVVRFPFKAGNDIVNYQKFISGVFLFFFFFSEEILKTQKDRYRKYSKLYIGKTYP